MKIVFDGTVLVSSVNGDKSFLMLEIGKGSGRAGELTTDPERKVGAAVEIDKLSERDNVVVFEFSRPESIAVVMEKLQILLMHQLNMPI